MDGNYENDSENYPTLTPHQIIGKKVLFGVTQGSCRSIQGRSRKKKQEIRIRRCCHIQHKYQVNLQIKLHRKDIFKDRSF